MEAIARKVLGPLAVTTCCKQTTRRSYIPNDTNFEITNFLADQYSLYYKDFEYTK